MLESVRCSKMLDYEFMANDSKSRVEKSGIPHTAHRHDILDDANALYTWVDMWTHSTGYQLLQSSHATPLSFHFTSFEHA